MGKKLSSERLESWVLVLILLCDPGHIACRSCVFPHRIGPGKLHE
jgi:hypothetical protein